MQTRCIITFKSLAKLRY